MRHYKADTYSPFFRPYPYAGSLSRFISDTFVP
jgi:hypothetical protein